jgi:hypothetical protein
MSIKNLTLAACAGALLSGCIITSGDTSDTLTEATFPQTDTGTTVEGGTTVDEPTTSGTTAGSATTSSGTSSTTVDPSTTDEPTTAVTTGDPSGTTDQTTGGAVGCGWNDRGNYYACAADGGTPGLEDPEMIDPIMCGEDVMGGVACMDDLPVSDIGCCTPEGVLYFCTEEGMVFEQNCNE